MKLPISLYHGSLGQIVDSQALLNSGATGCFIDHDFIAKNHWPKERLATPIYARAAKVQFSSVQEPLKLNLNLNLN